MRKEVIIIAGPNGSGKTTFAYDFLESYGYHFVDADEIAKQLDPEKLDDVKLKAGKLFFKRIYELGNGNKDFVVESTLSGKYMRKFFSFLRKRDYSITIIFIFLETPEVCINRIKERVLKGGHFIPAKDVIRRFYRSKSNFWNIYKKLSDKWYLIYNSSERFQEVAIGDENQFIIDDEELFQIFIKGIEA